MFLCVCMECNVSWVCLTDSSERVISMPHTIHAFSNANKTLKAAAAAAVLIKILQLVHTMRDRVREWQRERERLGSDNADVGWRNASAIFRRYWMHGSLPSREPSTDGQQENEHTRSPFFRAPYTHSKYSWTYFGVCAIHHHRQNVNIKYTFGCILDFRIKGFSDSFLCIFCVYVSARFIRTQIAGALEWEEKKIECIWADTPARTHKHTISSWIKRWK